MRIKTKTLMAALLAIAGLVLGHAPAGAVLTQADGDIFIGFRDTTSKNAYLINLGSYTQFTGLAPGGTLTFGTLNADLTTQFGGSWDATSTTFWGAFGSYQPGGTSIYVSRARTLASPNTPATAWTPITNSSGDRGIVDTAISAVRGGFVNNLTTTAATVANSGFQSGATGTGKYYPAVNASPDFSSVGTWTSIEGSFATAPKALDLFVLNNTGANGSTTRLGAFTIDGSAGVNRGVVTFTAVPEPSTYMLMALAGTIFMVFIRRRRALQN